MGTIFMVGIAVSNSILLVEFANRLMRDDVPLQEAVIRAGSIRLRPILMTSLAAVLGLLPMAFGVGRGAEANIPLARAVIGGLTISTILTLMVVPILYTLLKRESNHRGTETQRE
jgi:multidrug efflux pump subunit AcrB